MALFFLQRARAALRAMAVRSSGGTFAHRAFPALDAPAFAPSLPRATAAGFFRLFTTGASVHRPREIDRRRLTYYGAARILDLAVWSTDEMTKYRAVCVICAWVLLVTLVSSPGTWLPIGAGETKPECIGMLLEKLEKRDPDARYFCLPDTVDPREVKR